MSSTAELKKVKLNVTNIKSVLLDGKKSVDDKQKERQDFLDKLAEEKKQKQEEKGLEKPIDPKKKKPDLKSPIKSSMGLMNRIFTFVGAIVGGIVVKALPDIIDAVKNNKKIPNGETWHKPPYYIVNLPIATKDINENFDLENFIKNLTSKLN
mgnify:CR=1 FL=1